jgi:hypothetical protein
VRRLELAAIAAAIGVIAVLLAPSCRGPLVTVRASTLIVDHHGDVALTATVHGSIGRVAVELDGASARTPPTIEPPLPADCGGGCAITIHWDGDEARAGAHDLAVIAYDDEGHRGAAHVALDVRDRVTAAIARPVSLDLRGRAAATIVVHALYRGAVRGAVAIDGGAAIDARADDCRDGCDLAFPIDLAPMRAGPHAVAWTVTDGGGAIARGADTLVAGDVPWVSAIRVTGETDGPGTRLEVEVHLEDADSGADLGCSGQGQGMESVDYDDTDYTVRAWFVKPDGAPLGMDDLAGHRVRVRVIEDDSQPCPGPITRDDDDMGRSAPVAPAALPSVRGGFGEVVAITLAIGRPRPGP